MTFPNKEQQAVLNATNKTILLFAAAGAGKTDVLTAKTVEEANRLNTTNRGRYKQNKPYVLVLTHTRNARDNIQKRIDESESDLKIKKLIHIRTFHSFALQHINKNYYRYTVKNDCDEQIIRQIVANWPLKSNIKKKLIEGILSIYNDSKIQDLSIKKIIKLKYSYLKKYKKRILKTIKKLKIKKNEQGVITVDESTAVFVKLFKNQFLHHPSALIIDEFQDILPAQWEMIKILSQPQTHVVVATDPDQAIFTWAGASLKRLDDFRQYFPNYTEYYLTKNYRCSKQIIRFCNNICSQNKNSTGFKNRSTFQGPNKPVIVCNESISDLSGYIVNSVKKLLKTEVSLCDIAVVYSFNKDCHTLMEVLNKYKIPYKIYKNKKGKIKPIIKIIFAAHHVIENLNVTNPKSTVWKQWEIVLMQVEGIGNKYIVKIISWLQQRNKNCNYYIKSTKAGLNFNRLLKKLKKIKCNANNTSPDIRLKAIIKLVLDLPNVNKSKMGQELASLFYLCSLFNSLDEVIKRYQDTSYPICYPAGRQKPPFPEEYLTLSTIHKIKGSGFHTIFYLGTDDFLFEEHNSFNKKNIIEQIRLMNVACSRAERNLTLLFPISKQKWKSGKPADNPWTIIRKIPKKYYKLKTL